jgi:hypothetical protein
MISGVWPVVISSAMAFPVRGLNMMPTLLWPVARVTFSQLGAAPRIGPRSGVRGRKPAQAVSLLLSRKAGTNFVAVSYNSAVSFSVTWVSKPASSLVAPTRIAFPFGAMYVASPKMICLSGICQNSGHGGKTSWKVGNPLCKMSKGWGKHKYIDIVLEKKWGNLPSIFWPCPEF